MKVLVTGGSGMLGSEVISLLAKQGIPFAAPGHNEMDITDYASVYAAFARVQPDVVIHCAAWTRVDDAEKHPAECEAVNGMGTANVALACLRWDAKLVYVSTDYVFSGGDAEHPHRKDEAPRPVNVYGLTKLHGEIAVRSLLRKYFIVRAAWLYMPERPGFVRAILNKARAGEELRVVNDQLGAPTWVPDLAEALVKLCRTEDYGYHAAVPGGSCTWYEFAGAILREAELRGRVKPVSSAEWNAPAKRPACSLMVPTIELPDWRESLKKALKE